MSNFANVGWALSLKAKPGLKLVMIILANNADMDGFLELKIPERAAELQMSEARVVRLIRQAVELRWLEVWPRVGRENILRIPVEFPNGRPGSDLLSRDDYREVRRIVSLGRTADGASAAGGF